MSRIKSRAIPYLIAYALLAGCGGGGGGGDQGPISYSIQIAPSTLSLALGGASASATVSATVTRKGIVDTSVPVTWTSSDVNVASVSSTTQVATITGTGHGTATITATVSGGSATTAVTVVAPACTLSGSQPLLVVGTPTTASLSGADCRYSDSPTKMYRLVVAAGQNLNSITLTSSAFGPALAIFSGASATVATTDGSGNTATLNRILTPGTYWIGARSRTQTATGSFTLNATTTAVTVCSSTNAISTVVPTTAGTTNAGTLTSADCRIYDGTSADVYRVTVAANTTIQADLTSTAFNAYLWLTDASFNTLVEDNDGGGGTNARLTRALTPGTYYILANTLLFGESGAYSMTVKIP